MKRKVKWTREGITYEPCDRYAKMALKEMGMMEGHPAPTPAVNHEQVKSRSGKVDDPLIPNPTKFRRTVAILNYLSQDRVDLLYAVNQLTQRTSAPTMSAEAALKRTLSYLKGHMRKHTLHQWQVL